MWWKLCWSRSWQIEGVTDLFNYDNKVMGIFSKVMDAVILGILWLVCSLPVVTVGAASSAFYYAYNKCIRQDRGYAWRTFFSGFRSNFKQATKLWLTLLGMLLFTVVDYMILNAYAEVFPVAKVLMGCMIAAFLYLTVWGLYVFAYISRFEVETKIASKMAARLVLGNPGWSMVLVLVFAALVAGVFLVSFMGILAPAVYMAVANGILERVFRKHMSALDMKKELSYTANR